MPLGNLTSQFFANVYLNELDYFVKHKLKAKFYIRYVDDFVILHNSKDQLKKWKVDINKFLRDKLKLKLISQKKAFAQKKALNTLASTTNQQLLHDVINCVERYIIR